MRHRMHADKCFPSKGTLRIAKKTVKSGGRERMMMVVKRWKQSPLNVKYMMKNITKYTMEELE